MPSWAIYGREKARGPGPATVASSLETETLAWIAAVEGQGGSVSSPRQTIVNTLVVALKSGGLFTKTDRLFLLASESAIQAKVSLATGNHIFASVNNSPTFTVDEGYAGNRSTMFIDSGFNPTSGTPQFSLNSAFMFAYLRTTPTAGVDSEMGNGTFPGNRSHIQVRFFTTADQSSLCDGADGAYSLITSAKSVLYSRTASNLTTRYVNGVADGTNSAASTALHNLNFFILGCNNGSLVNPSGAQNSVAAWGSGLNGTEAAAYQAAFNAYMTSLGKNTY